MIGLARPAASCCEDADACMDDNDHERGIVLTEEQETQPPRPVAVARVALCAPRTEPALATTRCFCAVPQRPTSPDSIRTFDITHDARL